MLRPLSAVLALSGLLLLGGTAPAGKYNRKLSVGDPAPVWTDLPGVDGKKHSLADLAGKELVVVVVTCNHCPVAVGYEDRLIAFAKKYGGPEGKVAVVGISVNLGEADRLPRMKKRAAEKGFNFAYLHDESQDVGRKYGATVTPEFFVLDRDRKVAYLGGMDDNINARGARVSYLGEAVDALLAGKKVERAETRPVGCSVEYEKK